jgi:hypothetical protein
VHHHALVRVQMQGPMHVHYAAAQIWLVIWRLPRYGTPTAPAATSEKPQAASASRRTSGTTAVSFWSGPASVPKVSKLVSMKSTGIARLVPVASTDAPAGQDRQPFPPSLIPGGDDRSYVRVERGQGSQPAHGGPVRGPETFAGSGRGSAGSASRFPAKSS